MVDHIDLFAGIGGFAYGFDQVGIRTVAHVEIDKNCQTILKRHWPDALIFGDVCECGAHNLPYADIITFGSPCFPAGTLVMTERGYISIEDVVIGDRVLTHLGRWREVLRVGSKIANTIALQGQGHFGLETTRNHPIWGADTICSYPTLAGGKRGNIRHLGDPKWVSAEDMRGKRLAVIHNVASLNYPRIKSGGRYQEPPEMNENFWWMVGRWLGDGWLRRGQRTNRPDGESWGQIFICASHNEADSVYERLSWVADWQTIQERTVVKFRLSRKGLADWLFENFGIGAGGKHLPSWIYGLSESHRQQILEGYFSADGWIQPNGDWRATTISKKLAFGVRLLAETLGFSTSLHQTNVPPKTTIEGRIVNQNTQYQVCLRKGKRTNKLDGFGCSWYRVRTIIDCRKDIPVYNLEVAEDNTYVVEGVVVHNCQDLSVAGKREGLDGKRSNLFFEGARIIREIQPEWAIWENVPGALSSNKGRDFQAVLSELLGSEVPMPRSGRWARSGMARSGQTTLAWRVLDSQYFGLAQRRKRVFVVVHFRGEGSIEVLLESESLPGDTPPSRKAGQGTPAYAVRRSQTGSNGWGVDTEVGGTVDGSQSWGVAKEQSVDFGRTADRIKINPETSVTLQGDGGGMGAKTGLYLFQQNQREEVIGALRSHQSGGMEMYASYRMQRSDQYEEDQVSSTVAARDYKSSTDLTVCAYGVRRLTPIETMRLQGFPDNHCEGMSDTTIYRMAGNAVSTNVPEWLGGRIISYDNR
jgi:DNA-cytosine methyltransferase